MQLASRQTGTTEGIPVRAPVAPPVGIQGEDLVGNLPAASGQELDLGAVQHISDDHETVPAEKLGGVGRVARGQDLQPPDSRIGL